MQIENLDSALAVVTDRRAVRDRALVLSAATFLAAHAAELTTRVAVNITPDELADPIDDLPLDSRGHFSQLPADWGNPERDLSQRQFFEVLELCTDKLPAAQGRAFMMREFCVVRPAPRV